MAFGFGDIGSMFSKGMAQYGAGLDKMRDLPMQDKMMAAGQVMHGGVSPMDMFGALNRLGRPQTGAVPGAPPMLPQTSQAAQTPPIAPQPGDTSGQSPQDMIFTGLLPMLLKNGGAGALGGGLLGMGGSGGLAGGLGGLLGKFGFGH